MASEGQGAPPGAAPHCGGAAVARLEALFAAHGQDDYIGEPVSQLQHHLQCAHFAKIQYADLPHVEELTLAALLHDVGHLLGLARAKV